MSENFGSHDSPGEMPASLHPRRRRPGRAAARRSGRRRAVIGVQIVAAALSLAVFVGSGLAWATYDSFVSNVPTIPITLPPGSKPVKDLDGKDQNILIAGNDDRTGYTAQQLAELGTTADGGSENTDTMMLLHIPADGRKATVISFPRDSYVTIPGFGMDKLNAAYVDGVNASHGDKGAGASLLEATISKLTGLTIDGYIQVNLLGFYDISEAIGPITVCLNHSERPATSTAQFDNGATPTGVDGGFEPNGQFVKSYSGIDLSAGKTPIEGKQALAFVRQRHGLPGGDLDRIKRQQYFLGAVFRQIASAKTLLDPGKLSRLLKAVEGSLIVSKGTNLLSLASQVQDLTAGNVIFETIPISGPDNDTPVGDVEIVNTAEMPTFIDTLIGEDPAVALAKAKAAAPGSFTTDVVNASGVSNTATKNAAALTALGFKAVVGADSPGAFTATTIEYPLGMEGGAKALAAEVPGATVLVSTNVSTVTLYLGQNGVQAKALTPPPPATSAAAGTATASTSKPAPTATAPKPATSAPLPPGTTTAATAGCVD